MEASSDPALQELDALGIREVLDADSRPTFVLDLDPDDDSLEGTRALLPTFSNAALRLHEQLFDALIGSDAQGIAATAGAKDDGATYEEFRTWATGVTPHDDSKDVFPLSFLYGGLLWTGSTCRQRWRLISGNRLWRADARPRDLSSGPPLEVATGGLKAEQAAKMRQRSSEITQKATAPAQGEGSTVTGSTTLVSTKPPRPPPPSRSKPSFYPNTNTSSSDDTKGSSQSASISLILPEKAVSDWTAPNPKGVLTPHQQFARSVNWAATPLGPLDTWSPELRQVVNLVMGNPHPASLLWGSDLTMFYNQAYVDEVAGNKHPSLMGTGFSGPFAELWEGVAPIMAECARTGISVRKDEDYLPIDRRNFLEETFFSWSWTPIYGGKNRIQGFYNAPFEVTQQVLNRRRMQTVHKLGERTAQAKNVKQFWSYVLEPLEENHFDVPFALLYSVGENEDPDHSSISSGSTMSLKSCNFEGAIGVPSGHPAAAQQLDLKRSREGFVPSFREAMRTREPTLLRTRDGTLPEVLLDGIEWRGFGEPCKEAVIFPVRPTTGDNVLAFLVLGVNPRRPYDDGYKSFTAMLSRQLATSLASTILFEDEVRRSRDAAEAAALEKEKLTQQLALQARRLRRMTELSPLGMFFISPEGVLREANDRFYEMTGHDRDILVEMEMSWTDFISENSMKTMDEGWARLVSGVPWSGELQLKNQPGMPIELYGETFDETYSEFWVLFSAHAEFTPDGGAIRAIMGSITDVSSLKWLQALQTRRLQEAEETRRSQNEFIDITSHEMRNPLSAILQCADDILSSLTDSNSKQTPPSQDIVASCVDAAQTIALCVSHQKSIVDDILTISKLDSNLLLITPVIVQPEALLNRAMKMFEPELQAKDIRITYETDESYKKLAVDWVTVDPSRILQILINLMTNAIKFTAPSEKRHISVVVGASSHLPDSKGIPGFQYVPSKTHIHAFNINSEDWGTGEVVYIDFRVEDTGCGLTAEEKQILFQRFKQASPRTHAQYGGSGLGLFISKRLAELHGGQIGVASEAGVGSIFGFFIQARRAVPQFQSNLLDTLPIEQQLSGDPMLTQQVTPQRQDLATSSGLGGGLVASKASPSAPVLEPKDIAILVVEDNLINQKVLCNQLKKTGCIVHAANDGIEALAFLEQTSFYKKGGEKLDVILMDLEMPNMDGLTCVREIRKRENEGLISHVPTIAVTANVRNEQVAVAKLAGMDDVVSKPFRIPDLMDKVKALLAV